ncbi:CheA signal transduction histidine kinase [Ferroglobus placidus DSM 10642]|uniref:Chemotaxis protein CheA n=1 Tax=Ferroglobus placidus (strain DSM 10642 / AEDII12DO) TaxID=589924 RepID=D3RXM1_FERPA|nr:chemotaxis protein CheA [Ferroglobus placidus]ADC65234.1 CheA signal transduction histidine kinase [Ferroglobus placidus DSM 10642]
MVDDIENFKEEFLQEAREYIENINLEFIKLEKGDLQSVNEIFRAVHTIKGMAGFMGYKKIEELCHVLEAVLGAIKDGKIEISSDLVDVLLNSVDTLQELIDLVESSDTDEKDIDDVIVNLRAIIDSEKRKEKADDIRDKQLPDEEESEINAGFKVEVQLAEETPMKSVRALVVIETLKEFGKIVKIIPSEEEMEKENFDGKFIIYMNTDNIEKVETVLSKDSEIEKYNIQKIEKEKRAKKAPKKVKKSKKKDEKVEEEQRTDKVDSQKIIKVNQDALSKNAKPEKKVEFIKISTVQLDKIMNLVGELVINKGRLLKISTDYDIPELAEAVSILDKIVSSLQDEVMQVRMEKIEKVFSKFPRMVRDLSRKLGKEVELEMEGLDTELDRSVLEQMNDPLIHIVRNCVDHGIETPEERVAKGKSRVGKIKISAWRDKNNVIIEIEDDGKGIDPEKVKEKAIERGLISREEAEKMSEEELKMLIFMPGFSTKEQPTEVSGRGVGMDVVKTTVEKLGGTVKLYSEKDKGTKIRIQLPPTVAIIKSLLIKVGSEIYAIPISNVVGAIYLTDSDVENIHGSEFSLVRGKLIPVFRLRQLFGVNGTKPEKEVGIIVEKENEQFMLVADAIADLQEIVIKPLYGYLAKIKGFNGVTILGDGRVVPIIDVFTIIEG